MSTPCPSPLRAPARLLPWLLLPALAGCMTVHLHTGQAEPRVLHHLGWLQVEVPQAERAVVGRLQGVGLVSSPMGISAGYTHQRWAALGPQCRAVLWVQAGAQLADAAQQALHQVAGACLLPEAPSPAGDRHISTRVKQE